MPARAYCSFQDCSSSVTAVAVDTRPLSPVAPRPVCTAHAWYMSTVYAIDALAGLAPSDVAQLPRW